MGSAVGHRSDRHFSGQNRGPSSDLSRSAFGLLWQRSRGSASAGAVVGPSSRTRRGMRASSGSPIDPCPGATACRSSHSRRSPAEQGALAAFAPAQPARSPRVHRPPADPACRLARPGCSDRAPSTVRYRLRTGVPRRSPVVARAATCCCTRNRRADGAAHLLGAVIAESNGQTD